MTTPTREQVNKLLGMIQRHFPSLPLSDAYTDWKKWSEFAQAVFLFGASEARADLEADIDDGIDKIMAMSDKQIDALAGFEGRHPEDQATIARQCLDVAERNVKIAQLELQLAAQQAYAEQLREALQRLTQFNSSEEYVQVRTEHVSYGRSVLSNQSSTDALREYDAKLIANLKIEREHDERHSGRSPDDISL